MFPYSFGPTVTFLTNENQFNIQECKQNTNEQQQDSKFVIEMMDIKDNQSHKEINIKQQTCNTSDTYIQQEINSSLQYSFT
jgi:hypothetical protein